MFSVGQNGSGKSTILKAVEIAFAAIHNRIENSALSNASGVFVSPITTGAKRQTPMELTLVLGEKTISVNGDLPNDLVHFGEALGDAEHYVQIRARCKRNLAKINLEFSVNGARVTFSRLHEYFRNLGITTNSVQLIRQDQKQLKRANVAQEKNLTLEKRKRSLERKLNANELKLIKDEIVALRINIVKFMEFQKIITAKLFKVTNKHKV
ncbi:hypothetical protein BIW11_05810 [Tropilaelaps mercedesae]|uniref:Uncharacterized protein n=1 Tax=Tropilaelaps mercedesae TaxID=418985 RepID=A0A1V9Y0W0_9ACAR|nr:hypothetical protein BIW11_05810 [Tropilaelaps mercedesae]